MVGYHMVSGQGGRTGRQLERFHRTDRRRGSRECSPMFTKETLFDVADQVWSSRYRILDISLWFL